MPGKSNTDEFIKKAIMKHGNQYDYSKVDYQGRDIPVTIICSKHGEFQQTPHDHLSGCGCKLCYAERRGIIRRKNKKEFISQAKNIHGDKYDYSNVEYNGAHKPVTIICKKHNQEFNITPHNHLRGQGCPICGNEKKGLYQKSNTEEFVKKIKNLYGDKYDYTKIVYTNNHTPVTVICPTHGDFEMRPIDLLHGHGCPICSQKFGITERKVLDKLKEYFPNVIYHYHPEFLKSRTSYQHIDYFIPNLNIGIEYQGAQHFRSIERFGGEESFNKVTERDLRKYQKCAQNGIKIFYLSYEKNIPCDYFEPIYTNIEDLLKAINRQKEITFSTKDIENMVKECINKLLKT